MSFYGDPYGYGGGYGPPGYYPAYPAQYYSSGNTVYHHRRKPPKEKDNAQVWCDICDVGCIGQQSFIEHCGGRKHQLLERKKLQLQQQQSASPSPSSIQPQQDHHQLNTNTTPTITESTTIIPTTTESFSTTSSNTNITPTSSSNVRFSPYDSPSSQGSKVSQGKFYCELCKIYSNDQSTFQLHLSGKKHKINMQRLQPAVTDPYGPPLPPMSGISSSSSNIKPMLPTEVSYTSSSSSSTTTDAQNTSTPAHQTTSTTSSKHAGANTHAYTHTQTHAHMGMSLNTNTTTTTLTRTARSASDDLLLASVLEALTPSADETRMLAAHLEAVRGRVLAFSDSATDPVPEPPGAPSVPAPIVMDTKLVGPYAWGTLLKTNLVADIVVITKDPPTFGTLRYLQQDLLANLKETTVEIGKDTMDMHVRSTQRYAVHLLFTWLGAWELGDRAEGFAESDLGMHSPRDTPISPLSTTSHASNSLPWISKSSSDSSSSLADVHSTTSSSVESNPSDLISSTSSITSTPSLSASQTIDAHDINLLANRRALLMIRQALWFSHNSIAPNVRQCVKIMKDLRHRHTAFAPLNNWALEVIVVNALRSLPLSASISQSLRAIFAFIASGTLLPGVDVLDPCTQYGSVLQDLSQEDRLAITKSAQKILNDIAFGRWDVIVE